jgi:nucleotide-binding universal stress UspA family protein
VAIGRELGAQLVVVGSHRRNRANRLWSASVSRSVLHNAETNVACSATSKVAKVAQIPHIQQVLVATDFSETGDAAIRWAYGLLPDGGRVHLVTVHKPKSKPGPLATTDIFAGPRTPEEEAELEELRRKLERYEPDGAKDSGISTRAHVLMSEHIGDAICQAAERLNVDALVLGSNARGGVARFVLGSVAHHVTSKCTRPVLLVRPP